jgi:hypothetical protein
MPKSKKRFFVGLVKTELGTREIFKTDVQPLSDITGGRYVAVICPFRTKRGAEFMRDHGANNPHCRSVAEAEKLASKYAGENKMRFILTDIRKMMVRHGIATLSLDNFRNCNGYDRDGMGVFSFNRIGMTGDDFTHYRK